MFQLDGQTFFSIVIGAAISLITFWLGYRKTKSAHIEKLKSCNSELVSSVARRVAVERQAMNDEQFASLKLAKAYERSVVANHLIDFTVAKSVVFAQIVNSDFLNESSKNEIISLLENHDGSKSTDRSMTDDTASDEREYFKIKIENRINRVRNKWNALSALASFSIITGFAASAFLLSEISSLMNDLVGRKPINYVSDLLPIMLVVPVIVAIALEMFSSFIRRRDND